MATLRAQRECVREREGSGENPQARKLSTRGNTGYSMASVRLPHVPSDLGVFRHHFVDGPNQRHQVLFCTRSRIFWLRGAPWHGTDAKSKEGHEH